MCELILFSSKYVVSAHEFKQVNGTSLVDVKFQRLIMMVVWAINSQLYFFWIHKVKIIESHAWHRTWISRPSFSAFLNTLVLAIVSSSQLFIYIFEFHTIIHRLTERIYSLIFNRCAHSSLQRLWVDRKFRIRNFGFVDM